MVDSMKAELAFGARAMEMIITRTVAMVLTGAIVAMEATNQ